MAATTTIRAVSLLPVRQVLDRVRSTSSSRLIPSGVISKGPRQKERNRKAERQDQHDKAHSPVRHFKKREDLCRDLNEQPRGHYVSARDLVNIAPLQLGKEIAQVHLAAEAVPLA